MTHNTREGEEREEIETRFLKDFRAGKFINTHTNLQNPFEIEAWWHQELQKAREEERAKWAQRLPEDTFSVTIEGRFDKRIVANRKFVSMKSITSTGGKTLLLETEACAHQILQSLTQSELDQHTV